MIVMIGWTIAIAMAMAMIRSDKGCRGWDGDGMVMGWCQWIPFCAQRGCWIRSFRGNFAKKSNGSVIWIPIDLWDGMILFLNPSVWKSESTLFSKKTESSSWSNRCMAMHDHAWPANWTCIHPALCTHHTNFSETLRSQAQRSSWLRRGAWKNTDLWFWARSEQR